jgi:hypothetical protein
MSEDVCAVRLQHQRADRRRRRRRSAEPRRWSARWRRWERRQGVRRRVRVVVAQHQMASPGFGLVGTPLLSYERASRRCWWHPRAVFACILQEAGMPCPGRSVRTATPHPPRLVQRHVNPAGVADAGVAAAGGRVGWRPRKLRAGGRRQALAAAITVPNPWMATRWGPWLHPRTCSAAAAPPADTGWPRTRRSAGRGHCPKRVTGPVVSAAGSSRLPARLTRRCTS